MGLGKYEPYRRHCWALDELPESVCLSLVEAKSTTEGLLLSFRTWLDIPMSSFVLFEYFIKAPHELHFKLFPSDVLDKDGYPVPLVECGTRSITVRFDRLKLMPFSLDFTCSDQHIEQVLFTSPVYLLEEQVLAGI